MPNRRLAASLAWLSIAAPATASTLPPLDLAPGERAVALGLPAGAYDVGVRPGIALGVAAGWYWYFAHVGARATVTLARPWPGLRLGALTGAGGGSTNFDRPAWQAYVLGAAIAEWETGPVTWRGSLGPGLVVRPRPLTATEWGAGAQLGTAWTAELAPLWALELAIPIGTGHELTLGGNALIGWRGRW